MRDLRPIVTAWIALLLLSLVTTGIASAGDLASNSRHATAAAVLLLAGIKSRIILARYLEVEASLFWMRTFDLLVFSFLTLAFAIFVIGG